MNWRFLLSCRCEQADLKQAHRTKKDHLGCTFTAFLITAESGSQWFKLGDYFMFFGNETHLIYLKISK